MTEKDAGPCRCGGIGICHRHPERYADGRYIGVPEEQK